VLPVRQELNIYTYDWTFGNMPLGMLEVVQCFGKSLLLSLSRLMFLAGGSSYIDRAAGKLNNQLYCGV
jgi:hypothetical protein